MRFALVSLAMAASASAHCLVTFVKGANGVKMPGLSGTAAVPSPPPCLPLTQALPVIDGTPRDFTSNRCGSQGDTSIIRDMDIQQRKCGPLGRTQRNGYVVAEHMIANFMGVFKITTLPSPNGGSGGEDNIPQNLLAPGGGMGTNGGDIMGSLVKMAGNFFSPRDVMHQSRDVNDNTLGPDFCPALGKRQTLPPESFVAESFGMGAKSGLPTADSGNIITLNVREVRRPRVSSTYPS